MKEAIAIPQDAGSYSNRIRPGVYLELTKPRLSMLVIMTTIVGYYLARMGIEPPERIFHLIFGTSFLVGGSNALNQWMEREVDFKMKRTAGRPLPTKRIGSSSALIFAMLCSLGGLAYLNFFVNPFTALLGFAAFLSYVLLYTPLKKITTLATLVGAIPGALPIVMGWSAARPYFDLASWSLFFILFFWQLPHFLAIGWRCREDYRNAELSMLPALDETGRATSRQMVLYALALLPISLIPTIIGLTGVIYFIVAFILGLSYAGLSLLCALRPTERRASRLFFGSMYYLVFLLVFMVIDKR
ncbi:MAG: protoheme IX farnesyltransferase [Candidatus Omnitrophica bacterium]|nr:protoheme IX farnesyltransferase [Candidatus Omnitrophota bacterium]